MLIIFLLHFLLTFNVNVQAVGSEDDLEDWVHVDGATAESGVAPHGAAADDASEQPLSLEEIKRQILSEDKDLEYSGRVSNLQQVLFIFRRKSGPERVSFMLNRRTGQIERVL